MESTRLRGSRLKIFFADKMLTRSINQSEKRYQRNKTLSVGINEIHQLDLADLSNLSKYNNGVRYLLTWIDVFSKYAWVIPLKNKTGKALVKAFKTNIESSGRPPVMIHTDKGTEFTNHACSK